MPLASGCPSKVSGQRAVAGLIRYAAYLRRSRAAGPTTAAHRQP
ncbi:hypothetical protein [Pyrinomonas sp.]